MVLTLFAGYGTHARPRTYLKEQKKFLIFSLLRVDKVEKYDKIELTNQEKEATN